MECVHIKAGLHCIQSPFAIPFIMGVGPAKSGSTSLFLNIRKHPSIEIGNATRRGHCCGPELYYFLNPFKDDRNNLTMARLQEYFPTRFDRHAIKVLMWGEKTPLYSDHPLIPFLVHAMLRRPRIIFTTRECAQLDASLFLHRIKHDGYHGSYSSWTAQRLAAYVQFKQCRRNSMLQMGIADDGALYGGGISLSAVESIESELYQQCGMGTVPGSGNSFTASLAGRSLMRWSFVFPSLLCITMITQATSPATTASLLANFTSVSILPWKNWQPTRHHVLAAADLQRNKSLRSVHSAMQAVTMTCEADNLVSYERRLCW